MEVTRVFDLLAYQKSNFPKDDMVASKVNGQWAKFSTSRFKEIVNQVSLGLYQLGIRKDDKVAIVSFNRPEWNFIDFGIQQIGAVSVPMYPTITEEEYKYIFTDAGVKIIFVANKELYQKVKNATKDLEGITKIYTFDAIEGAEHWSGITHLGKDLSESLLDETKKAVKPDDLLTLIYTSGTTGNPKGVMLTHNNLVSNFKASAPLMPVDNRHRALSFLPLCHIYERMLNYLYIYCGVSIYYAESIDTVSENLKEVHPNIFVTVPRLLEKVYDRIYAKGKELTGIKKILFFWALNLGLKYDLNISGGLFYNLQMKIANKIIFNKWREALGGEVMAVVSGGAALQPRLARVFWAAQIPIMEGYGLTETSPVICVNRVQPAENRISTVGPVIEGVEMKIAEDGEILTRGPHVMKGYYNKPELTAEVINSEGWFHTGDIGELVEGRFLKITDRKKEMFKTSGGKYIAPQQIENKLKESTMIEQALVVGEGQKFPSVLIVPAFAALKDYCEFKGITYTTNAEMIKHDAVIEKFDKEIESRNEAFAQYEKVKKFALLPNMWTIESGEMTAKLSLRRKIITQNNLKTVESFYESNL